MNVAEFRKQLFESNTNMQVQNTLKEAQASGISLHDLLEGTLLDGFLEKEITKFSTCEEKRLPQQRYDVRLNQDFSFNLEIFELQPDAAMPTGTEELKGNWELMHLNDEGFIVKLMSEKSGTPPNKRPFLKITHEDIGWIDKI